MLERRSWLVWVWAGYAVVVVFLDVGVTAAHHHVWTLTTVAVGLNEALLSIVVPLSAALIVWKRPRNRIGWLLLAGGLYFPVSSTFRLLRPSVSEGVETWLAWGQQSLFWAAIGTMLALVPLLFPNGRLPSLRWRPVAWVAVLSILALTVGNAISPDLLAADGMANPAARSGDGSVAGAVIVIGAVGFTSALLGAIASVVVRFRGSVGVERLQLRWLLLGVSGALAGWVTAGAIQGVTGDMEAGGWAFGLGIMLIPVAVTVAVLRYRLYDIDRVVSRTVTYAAVTLVLVAVYAAGIVGFGGMIRAATGGSGGDLVVAGTTLVVAALFQPLRRRVQAVVDRRFNRSRYDAERTFRAFSARLRDEIELRHLQADLVRVTSKTLQPSTVSMWLSPTASEEGPP